MQRPWPHSHTVVELYREVREFRAEMITRFEQLDERVGSVETGLARLQRQVAGHEVRLVQVEDRLTHVEDRLTHVESRLTQVEDRLIQVEDRLTHVESRLTKVEVQLIQVQDRLTEVDGHLTDVMETVKGQNVMLVEILARLPQAS